MPVSHSQQRATRKYMEKAYDRIALIVHKGKRECYKAHAATMDESLNAFINRAIAEAMERDKSGNI